MPWLARCSRRVHGHHPAHLLQDIYMVNELTTISNTGTRPSMRATDKAPIDENKAANSISVAPDSQKLLLWTHQVTQHFR